MMDVKVTGAFLCTQAVTKVMLRQGWGGSIVNVISVEAKISRPTDLAYATASGALYTFTTKAGRARAPHGIRVNGVSPGTTDTARNDALYGFPRSPEWAARVASIPIGRAGTPEEMGDFIAWLCSKEAEFIVGRLCLKKQFCTNSRHSAQKVYHVQMPIKKPSLQSSGFRDNDAD